MNKSSATLHSASRPASAVQRGPLLDIDLSAIRANYSSMRVRYGGRDLSAVLKSDSYGLGLEPIARSLGAAGCTTFWVNDLEEAARLRSVVPDPTVYALFGLGLHDPEDFVETGVIPVLASLDELVQCSRAAARSSRRMRVAVQLDTGLGRLGLNRADVALLSEQGELLAPFELSCWVSHLAAFDLPDDPMNRLQRQMLLDWTSLLPKAPISLASSSGIFMGSDWHFDIARIGSALFGVQTSTRWQEGLQPCYRLTAPVLRVATFPAGSRVGYRGASELERTSRIATLALGYSNGLPRDFAKQARVYLNDVPAPFVGGISMNLSMVDVTDVSDPDVVPGRVVEVLGPRQTVDAVASELDCAPNLLLTQIGSGCRRRYLDGAPDDGAAR
ncbi:alanine racemase [Microbaculum marinum]|uniref:alanine racemase n=1 Tax=Microbaculum marinum TaxID=1764581 RepID=A0AAW9RU39_9HYPH